LFFGETLPKSDGQKWLAKFIKGIFIKIKRILPYHGRRTKIACHFMHSS
jgi:hypothetical protein